MVRQKNHDQCPIRINYIGAHPSLATTKTRLPPPSLTHSRSITYVNFSVFLFLHLRTQTFSLTRRLKVGLHLPVRYRTQTGADSGQGGTCPYPPTAVDHGRAAHATCGDGSNSGQTGMSIPHWLAPSRNLFRCNGLPSILCVLIFAFKNTDFPAQMSGRARPA